MAVGDVVNNITSVSSGAFLDIQPSAGTEWVIHSIYLDKGVGSAAGPGADMEYFDGANRLVFMTGQVGPLVLANLQLHVTNSIRVRVLNGDAGARLMGYDGVQTK